jgi:hypothetical protein
MYVDCPVLLRLNPSADAPRTTVSSATQVMTRLMLRLQLQGGLRSLSAISANVYVD